MFNYVIVMAELIVCAYYNNNKKKKVGVHYVYTFMFRELVDLVGYKDQ